MDGSRVRVGDGGCVLFLIRNCPNVLCDSRVGLVAKSLVVIGQKGVGRISWPGISPNVTTQPGRDGLVARWLLLNLTCLVIGSVLCLKTALVK